MQTQSAGHEEAADPPWGGGGFEDGFWWRKSMSLISRPWLWEVFAIAMCVSMCRVYWWHCVPVVWCTCGPSWAHTPGSYVGETSSMKCKLSQSLSISCISALFYSHYSINLAFVSCNSSESYILLVWPLGSDCVYIGTAVGEVRSISVMGPNLASSHDQPSSSSTAAAASGERSFTLPIYYHSDVFGGR